MWRSWDSPKVAPSPGPTPQDSLRGTITQGSSPSAKDSMRGVASQGSSPNVKDSNATAQASIGASPSASASASAKASGGASPSASASASGSASAVATGHGTVLSWFRSRGSPTESKGSKSGDHKSERSSWERVERATALGSERGPMERSTGDRGPGGRERGGGDREAQGREGREGREGLSGRGGATSTAASSSTVYFPPLWPVCHPAVGTGRILPLSESSSMTDSERGSGVGMSETRDGSESERVGRSVSGSVEEHSELGNSSESERGGESESDKLSRDVSASQSVEEHEGREEKRERGSAERGESGKDKRWKRGGYSDNSWVLAGYSDTTEVLCIDSNSSGLGAYAYSDREEGAYRDVGKLQPSAFEGTKEQVQGITWIAVDMNEKASPRGARSMPRSRGGYSDVGRSGYSDSDEGVHSDSPMRLHSDSPKGLHSDSPKGVHSDSETRLHHGVTPKVHLSSVGASTDSASNPVRFPVLPPSRRLQHSPQRSSLRPSHGASSPSLSTLPTPPLPFSSASPSPWRNPQNIPKEHPREDPQEYPREDPQEHPLGSPQEPPQEFSRENLQGYTLGKPQGSLGLAPLRKSTSSSSANSADSLADMVSASSAVSAVSQSLPPAPPSSPLYTLPISTPNAAQSAPGVPLASAPGAPLASAPGVPLAPGQVTSSAPVATVGCSLDSTQSSPGVPVRSERSTVGCSLDSTQSTSGVPVRSERAAVGCSLDSTQSTPGVPVRSKRVGRSTVGCSLDSTQSTPGVPVSSERVGRSTVGCSLDSTQSSPGVPVRSERVGRSISGKPHKARGPQQIRSVMFPATAARAGSGGSLGTPAGVPKSAAGEPKHTDSAPSPKTRAGAEAEAGNGSGRGSGLGASEGLPKGIPTSGGPPRPTDSVSRSAEGVAGHTIGAPRHRDSVFSSMEGVPGRGESQGVPSPSKGSGVPSASSASQGALLNQCQPFFKGEALEGPSFGGNQPSGEASLASLASLAGGSRVHQGATAGVPVLAGTGSALQQWCTQSAPKGEGSGDGGPALPTGSSSSASRDGSRGSPAPRLSPKRRSQHPPRHGTSPHRAHNAHATPLSSSPTAQRHPQHPSPPSPAPPASLNTTSTTTGTPSGTPTNTACVSVAHRPQEGGPKVHHSPVAHPSAGGGAPPRALTVSSCFPDSPCPSPEREIQNQRAGARAREIDGASARHILEKLDVDHPEKLQWQQQQHGQHLGQAQGRQHPQPLQQQGRGQGRGQGQGQGQPEGGAPAENGGHAQGHTNGDAPREEKGASRGLTEGGAPQEGARVSPRHTKAVEPRDTVVVRGPAEEALPWHTRDAREGTDSYPWCTRGTGEGTVEALPWHTRGAREGTLEAYSWRTVRNKGEEAAGSGLMGFWLGLILGALLGEAERHLLKLEMGKERDVAVLLREEVGKERELAALLAHEVAHQWCAKQEAMRLAVASELDMELQIVHGAGAPPSSSSPPPFSHSSPLSSHSPPVSHSPLSSLPPTSSNAPGAGTGTGAGAGAGAGVLQDSPNRRNTDAPPVRRRSLGHDYSKGILAQSVEGRLPRRTRSATEGAFVNENSLSGHPASQAYGSPNRAYAGQAQVGANRVQLHDATAHQEGVTDWGALTSRRLLFTGARRSSPGQGSPGNAVRRWEAGGGVAGGPSEEEERDKGGSVSLVGSAVRGWETTWRVQQLEKEVLECRLELSATRSELLAARAEMDRARGLRHIQGLSPGAQDGGVVESSRSEGKKAEWHQGLAQDLCEAEGSPNEDSHGEFLSVDLPARQKAPSEGLQREQGKEQKRETPGRLSKGLLEIQSEEREEDLVQRREAPGRLRKGFLKSRSSTDGVGEEHRQEGGLARGTAQAQHSSVGLSVLIQGREEQRRRGREAESPSQVAEEELQRAKEELRRLQERLVQGLEKGGAQGTEPQGTDPQGMDPQETGAQGTNPQRTGALGVERGSVEGSVAEGSVAEGSVAEESVEVERESGTRGCAKWRVQPSPLELRMMRERHRMQMLRVCLELTQIQEHKAKVEATKWRDEAEESEALLAEKCRQFRRLVEAHEELKVELGYNKSPIRHMMRSPLPDPGASSDPPVLALST